MKKKTIWIIKNKLQFLHSFLFTLFQLIQLNNDRIIIIYEKPSHSAYNIPNVNYVIYIYFIVV